MSDKVRRTRAGHVEWRCVACGRWYWRLSRHIRNRQHREAVA